MVKSGLLQKRGDRCGQVSRHSPDILGYGAGQEKWTEQTVCQIQKVLQEIQISSDEAHWKTNRGRSWPSGTHIWDRSQACRCLPPEKWISYRDPFQVFCWRETKTCRLAICCGSHGSSWVSRLYKSISQLVQRNPQLYGCPMVKWIYWRLQQQNESLEASLLRDA